AACDAQGIDRFIVGGISMGAAIALRIAVRHPGRVAGLVLARPAWLFDAGPDNMRPYGEVAALMRALPRDAARPAFARAEPAEALRRDAPDNLAALLNFFDRPDRAVTSDLLGAIAIDGPGVTEAEVASLRIPTLVIGHGVDHAHPLVYAKRLAATIPGS